MAFLFASVCSNSFIIICLASSFERSAIFSSSNSLSFSKLDTSFSLLITSVSKFCTLISSFSILSSFLFNCSSLWKFLLSSADISFLLSTISRFVSSFNLISNSFILNFAFLSSSSASFFALSKIVLASFSAVPKFLFSYFFSNYYP